MWPIKYSLYHVTYVPAKFEVANTPIPHRPRIPELTRIDKYLDSWLNRTQFVMVLTDSQSP